MQEKKLFFFEEQKKTPGPHGAFQVLQVLQEAY